MPLGKQAFQLQGAPGLAFSGKFGENSLLSDATGAVFAEKALWHAFIMHALLMHAGNGTSPILVRSTPTSS